VNRKRFPLLFLILAAPAAACAWGEDGHKIIADIAARELTPQAAAQVKDLLNGWEMTDVASWADHVRSEPKYQWTAPLHYVNVPPGAEGFDFQRDCPAGECVVGAIHKFIAVLHDPAADHAKKAEALKFLLHFVGDVHQPLHVSYAHDKGGNDIKVEFFYDRTNLHRVWDTLLIERTKRPWRDYADYLYARITPQQRQKWASPLDPSAWATESYKLAVSHAYAIPKDGQLGQEYFDSNLPVVEDRLSMAGIRLGAMLNAIFGDGAGLPAAPPLATQPASAPAMSSIPATSPAPAAARAADVATASAPTASRPADSR
jgi:hypothetical protein